MLHTNLLIETESLAVATLSQDPEEHIFIAEAFQGVDRWALQLRAAESFAGFLSDAGQGRVDLLVLNDGGARGERAALVRRLRLAGFEGALLVLVDETSEPRDFLRAGADATLDRENLEPIFIESIIAVALSLPHRGS